MPHTAEFILGEFVIYPGHGLGKLERLETHQVGNSDLQMFVITFDRDRLTLRVPVGKAASAGLRKLSSPGEVEDALSTLKGPASGKRMVWNRQAIEYATKITSGNLTSIAEVIRDLHPTTTEREPSHSQRLIYEQARDRLTKELAAIEGIAAESVSTRLDALLAAA